MIGIKAFWGSIRYGMYIDVGKCVASVFFILIIGRNFLHGTQTHRHSLTHSLQGLLWACERVQYSVTFYYLQERNILQYSHSFLSDWVREGVTVWSEWESEWVSEWACECFNGSCAAASSLLSWAHHSLKLTVSFSHCTHCYWTSWSTHTSAVREWTTPLPHSTVMITTVVCHS